MGRFLELLRQEVETHEAEIREKIGELKPEELVEWCKAEIETYEKFFDSRKWAWDPFEIIRHSTTPDDHEAVISMAQKSH
jgi:hypothetical protein